LPHLIPGFKIAPPHFWGGYFFPAVPIGGVDFIFLPARPCR
jgi:hypothetical protein